MHYRPRRSTYTLLFRVGLGGAVEALSQRPHVEALVLNPFMLNPPHGAPLIELPLLKTPYVEPTLFYTFTIYR